MQTDGIIVGAGPVGHLQRFSAECLVLKHM